MYGPQKCRSIKASDLNPRCHDDVAILSISQVVTLMWFSLVLRLNARLEYSSVLFKHDVTCIPNCHQNSNRDRIFWTRLHDAMQHFCDWFYQWFSDAIYRPPVRQGNEREGESLGDKHSSNFWREARRHSPYYMVLHGQSTTIRTEPIPRSLNLHDVKRFMKLFLQMNCIKKVTFDKAFLLNV